MSKRGLPTGVRMRHDSHYVEDLAGPNRSVGRKIPINLIQPNPDQPRSEIGDLTELSGSIKEKGILEPILVKPDSKSGTWMIIAGERRWRAANLAGLEEVPCIELDIDEKDVAEIALIENLQRKDLTIWEEVDGYAYLIEKFGYTHEEIAKKIGKSRTTITESLSIAGLPESIRTKCRQVSITAKSALLEIARQFDEKAMHEFLDNTINKPVNRETVRGKAKTNNKSSKNLVVVAEKKFDENNLSNNIFTYISENETFNLEIHFLKENNFGKKEILFALKEAFNKIKVEP